ncbi:hypothetical protein N657DRAFT_676531 [Parathielavia appendiculata]|uniref:Uncharacterized protein n=1 Tax=Parathielavia appendiculata TaxID=2587402 RepID=A0AAN6U970_9PEZI|nr:hypothetical protein N657DRAFT_676531 [Parathielavia appendiculata]
MAPTTPPRDLTTEPRSNGNNEKRSTHEPSEPPLSSSSVGDRLAQALRDLARGEQTANTLEANLNNLESKLDELLASFGASSQDMDAIDGEDKQQQKRRSENEKGAAEGEGGK